MLGVRRGHGPAGTDDGGFHRPVPAGA
jgi:hypothetical protein